MGVDLFGEVADAGLLFGRGDGEGEGFEAAGFVVARIVTDTEPATSRQCPDHMDATRKHTETIGIVERDCDQLVVWRNRGIEKLEDAVLGGFYSGDVARTDRPMPRRNS